MKTKRLYVALLVALVLASGFELEARAITHAEKSWSEIQASGSGNMDSNRYWLAEPQLQDALAIAENAGFKDLRLAKSLGELGRLNTIRGRFSIAEPYFEKELAVKEEALGIQDNRLVPAMGSLIQFYLNYGTTRKAYPLTQEMLAMIDGKLSEPIEKKSDKVKFKKGMTLEAWAGSAADAARDPLLEWAITCDAVGGAYKNHGDWEMSERVYKAGLDLKATILGKGHLSLANSYDCLGMVCLSKGDYVDAASYLADALEITENIQPPEHPDVYSRLDKLARCYIKAGKFSEAEALYLRAQNLWKNEPSKHGNECRALYALGSLYVDEQKYAAAAHLLSRAVRMEAAIDGDYSIQLVPYLQRYAYALYHLGRRGESASLISRAHAISPPEIPVIPLVATSAKTVNASYFKEPREQTDLDASRHFGDSRRIMGVKHKHKHH
jgi:tetratricopeptide (TPR) repeat protein